MNPSEQTGDASQPRNARASAASVCSAFMSAFDQLGKAMTPPESAERHFREARKQALLGLRELLDHRIEKMSREETKGTRVVVE